MVGFRPLEEADLPMLHEWINRPHVAQWWGSAGPPKEFEGTWKKYLHRLNPSSPVKPYIALLEGRPMGFIQSYVAMGSGDGWWEDETDPGVRGTDQFLCDESLLGRGIGTRLVAAFVDHLFADSRVTRVQTDPSPRNARAIRCYEKAGFRRVREIDTPDGRALLMVVDRTMRGAPCMREA